MTGTKNHIFQKNKNEIEEPYPSSLHIIGYSLHNSNTKMKNILKKIHHNQPA